MAYADACGGCNRIQYWSNPDISYGDLPTGTTNTHNNARLLNEKIPNTMSLLQPDNTVTVQNVDIATAKEGDIIAKTMVTTSGNVTIQSGQEYSFRAGSVVILEPNFVVEEGSTFVSEIVAVSDCGQPDNESSNYNKTDGFTNYVFENSSKLISNFTAYPNPTTDLITVNLNVSEAGSMDFIVYDYLGKVEKKFGKYTVENGIFSQEFSLSNLANGVYFIAVIFDGNEVLYHKIIKNK